MRTRIFCLCFFLVSGAIVFGDNGARADAPVTPGAVRSIVTPRLTPNAKAHTHPPHGVAASPTPKPRHKRRR